MRAIKSRVTPAARIGGLTDAGAVKVHTSPRAVTGTTPAMKSSFSPSPVPMRLRSTWGAVDSLFDAIGS